MSEERLSRSEWVVLRENRTHQQQSGFICDENESYDWGFGKKVKREPVSEGNTTMFFSMEDMKKRVDNASVDDYIKSIENYEIGNGQ